MNDKGLTQAEGAIKKATVIAIAGYIIAFCRLAHYQFDISQLKFSSFPFIFYAGAFCAIYLLLNFKPFNKITTTNRILASLGAKFTHDNGYTRSFSVVVQGFYQNKQ